MILHFVNGSTAECEVTKEGRKYIYFIAGAWRCRYRLNKETNEVEVSPYWRKEPKMYVTN